MSSESSSPLNTATAKLKKALNAKRERLVEIYLADGPDGLKDALELDDGRSFDVVFDYVVFETNAIKRCAKLYADFFRGQFALRGPAAVRSFLRLDAERYDAVFEEIFDLTGVSTGALHDYVRLHGAEFARQIKDGEAGGLRRSLCLDGKKYQPLWMEVMEMLMNVVCNEYYEERHAENGLKSFSLMMNGLRGQRSLRSFHKMWEFST